MTSFTGKSRNRKIKRSRKLQMKKGKILCSCQLWHFAHIDLLFSALGRQKTVNYAFSFLNLVCSSRDVTPRLDGMATAHSPPNKNKFRCQHITSQLIVSRELAVSPVLLCLLSRRFRFFSRLVVLIDSRLNQLYTWFNSQPCLSKFFQEFSVPWGPQLLDSLFEVLLATHKQKQKLPKRNGER